MIGPDRRILGYKMRSHIANSLKKRCKAIRNAVNAYNKAANAFSPPRPHVDWDRIAKFEFLEEFEMLKYSQRDPGTEFADPTVRELIKVWRRVVRAREQVVRGQIETRRVHTAIRDEEIKFQRILSTMDRADPLYQAVETFCTRRRRMNAHLLARIRQIYALPIFTATKGPGVRAGTTRNTQQPITALPPDQTIATPGTSDRPSGPSDSIPPISSPSTVNPTSPNTTAQEAEGWSSDEDGEEDDEELQGTMGALCDWTGGLI